MTIAFGTVVAGGPINTHEGGENYCEDPIATCILLYAPIAGIESHLGLEFEYGSGPPPDPLSAWINGPDEVPETESCTWQADVTGGVTPYSYQWSGVLSGSGSSITGIVGGSGYLILMVTGDESDQASDSLFIYVDEELEECEA